MKSIAEQWQGFSEMIFRKTPASSVQRAEMRKAFYAGAWSLFCAMEEIGMPHISEDEGMEFLDKWKVECDAFKKQLMREYSESN